MEPEYAIRILFNGTGKTVSFCPKYFSIFVMNDTKKKSAFSPQLYEGLPPKKQRKAAFWLRLKMYAESYDFQELRSELSDVSIWAIRENPEQIERIFSLQNAFAELLLLVGGNTVLIDQETEKWDQVALQEKAEK